MFSDAQRMMQSHSLSYASLLQTSYLFRCFLDPHTSCEEVLSNARLLTGAKLDLKLHITYFFEAPVLTSCDLFHYSSTMDWLSSMCFGTAVPPSTTKHCSSDAHWMHTGHHRSCCFCVNQCKSESKWRPRTLLARKISGAFFLLKALVQENLYEPLWGYKQRILYSIHPLAAYFVELWGSVRRRCW